jgi:pimeloyl-ACP methyl ester carboxylesterase
MKNYLLVHGAWGAAAEFDEVVKLLSDDGSRITSIDLPGHGENKAAIDKITMDAYVQTVVDTINTINEKVILVGHSLAGAIISQVAEVIPDSIDRLIYVAAIVSRQLLCPVVLPQLIMLPKHSRCFTIVTLSLYFTSLRPSCPKINSLVRAVRQSLILRCNVRNCALPEYFSGSISHSLCITSLAVMVESILNQLSIIDQSDSNGSGRVLHVLVLASLAL